MLTAELDNKNIYLQADGNTNYGRKYPAKCLFMSAGRQWNCCHKTEHFHHVEGAL